MHEDNREMNDQLETLWKQFLRDRADEAAKDKLILNYLPLVNMEKGYLREDWPDEAIFAE